MVGLIALSLSGCSTFKGWFSPDAAAPEVKAIPTVYLGSVIADDPEAVGAGDLILRQNGNAVDAAAAVALMLTVTLPSRAGLMGGGVCLVHDADRAQVDAIEFLPAAVPGSPVEIPGFVRGIAALQARYGVLDWRQLVAGAERAALSGVALSTQLSTDAASAGITIPQGRHQEPALAAVLGQLRLNGATDFYTGGLAGQLVASGLPAAALASYAPAWRPALRIAAGNDLLYFAPDTGGRAAAAAYGVLTNDQAAAADPARRFAAARASLQGAAEPSASTGFVVSDADGRTVGCALSMGGLFGTRKKLVNPALYPAAPIAGAANAQLALVPAIAYNAHVNQVLATFAGSAGAAAPADLAAIAFGILRKGEDGASAVGALRQPGDTGAGAVPDRLALLNCPGGLPRTPKSCVAVKDPRGWGYAQTVDLVKQ